MRPPSRAREIAPADLARASCLECRAEVWAWRSGRLRALKVPKILDRFAWRGADLLSLHDCAGLAGPEDLDDPDIGWTEPEPPGT